MKKSLAMIGAMTVILSACTTTTTDSGSASSSSVSSRISQMSRSATSVHTTTSKVPASVPTAIARVIKISAKDWEFSPSSINVKQGENVVLEITSTAGNHGFAIPEMGINEKFDVGQIIHITLDTSKTGTFTFKCSVPCGPGHKEMMGTIVIH